MKTRLYSLIPSLCLGLVLAGCAHVDAPAPSSPDDPRVLALNISRLPSDVFGNSSSGALLSSGYDGGPVGTSLLAVVPFPRQADRVILPQTTRITAFADNAGRDLLEPERKASVFPSRQPLRVRQTDDTHLTLILHSGLTPAATASRITAKVGICQAPASAEQESRRENIAVRPDSFPLGPAKITLRAQGGGGSSAPAGWLLRYDPEPGIIVSCLRVTESGAADPLLEIIMPAPENPLGFARQNPAPRARGGASYVSSPEGAGYLLSLKEGATLVIELRYFKADRVVEKEYTLSTGLGG